MARKTIDNLKIAELKRQRGDSGSGASAEACRRALDVNKLQNFWSCASVCAGFACNAVFWVWCLLFAGAPTLHVAFWVGALLGFLAETALFIWSVLCGVKKRNAVTPLIAFCVSAVLLLVYEICLAVYLGQLLNFLLTVIFAVFSVALVGFIGRLVKRSVFESGKSTALTKTKIFLLGLFTVIFCVLSAFCAVFIGSGTSGGNFKLSRNASYEYSEELGGYTLSRVYYTVGDAVGSGVGAPLVLEENVTKNFKKAPLVGIADGAFDGVKSVKSVNVPASVLSASARAFENSGVKELIINASAFDFNGCTAGTEIENVILTDGGCVLANAFTADGGVTFTVPEDRTDAFRSAYAEHADAFAPSIDGGRLYINFNDGSRPLEGWGTKIFKRDDLRRVDGGYEITVEIPQGFSLYRDGENRRERLVKLGADGEFIPDGALSTVIEVSDSANVYCEWSEIFNIEYLGADGYFDGDTAQKSYFDNRNGSADNVVLPVASKEGYTFYGWYLEEGGDRKYIEAPIADTDGRDYSLHAEFLENFDIALDLNGGTLNGAPEYYHEKSEITLPSPVREGFTFVSWSKDGDGVYAPQIPYDSQGDLSFKAEWKLNAPTVSAVNYSGIYDGQSHSAGVTATHSVAGVEFAYEWRSATAGATFNVKNVADSVSGVYSVTASFDGYTSDAVTVSVTASVTPKSVTAVWSGSGFVYDNTDHTVTATLSGVADGDTLAPALSGNTAKNAGDYTATATIENGNYTLLNGAYNYTVARASYDMGGVTFADGTHEYDGQSHSLQIAGTLPTGLDGVQVTVSYSGSATNVMDGARTVTASFATTSQNYATPRNMTARISITPAEYDMSEVTFEDGTHVYDGRSHSLQIAGTLPAGLDGVRVTVSYSGSATNVADGEQTVTASFATTSQNYNTPRNMTARISITPADYDMSGVSFADGTREYDGQTHSLQIAGTLPAGLDGIPVTVSYSGSQTAVGTATVTASFSGSNNYNKPADKTAQITVTPATITAEVTAYSGVYEDGASLIVNVNATTADGSAYTITYGSGENGEYSATAPVMSENVLEYTVWYKITAENHAEYKGSVQITVSAPEVPEEEQDG